MPHTTGSVEMLCLILLLCYCASYYRQCGNVVSDSVIVLLLCLVLQAVNMFKNKIYRYLIREFFT